MKKTYTTFAIIGVIALVAGGTAVYMATSSPSVPTDTIAMQAASSTGATSTDQGVHPVTPSSVRQLPQKTPSQKGPSQPTPSSGVRALLARRGNFQCDYAQATRSSQSNHVIYLSNGKMRGEFRTRAGENSKSSMAVYDGSYLYTWTEGETTGLKTSFLSLSQLPAVVPEDLTSGASYGSGVDTVGWQCHAWIRDSALLAPPSYVTFRSR